MDSDDPNLSTYLLRRAWLSAGLWLRLRVAAKRMSKQVVASLTFVGGCCTPLSEAPLSEVQASGLAVRFKALGDPVRLRLLSMIASTDEARVCDLTGSFTVAGPTISHHLKVLREAGLVHGERRGTWVYYRARPHALRQLADLLDTAAAVSV